MEPMANVFVGEFKNVKIKLGATEKKKDSLYKQK